MHLNASVMLSIISLAVSVTVAWLTLFRRGSLYMTQPVQVAFVFENGKPKVFLRTLLYATGKRGYVIEGLYLKLEHPEAKRVFGFWGYGERNELMVAGGLRISEDGVAYNHHFLENAEDSDFEFVPGDYEISAYAKIVNRSTSRLLGTFRLTLPAGEAMIMRMRGKGVLFTRDPETNIYRPSLSDPIK